MGWYGARWVGMELGGLVWSRWVGMELLGRVTREMG